MPTGTWRLVNGLLLAVGLVLLGLLVVHLDGAEVLSHLVRAGWMLLPAFAAYVGGLVASAGAWRESLGTDGPRPSFSRVLAVFWAGHALNSTTTGVSGEWYKATVLSREVDGNRVVASLLVYSYLTAVSILVTLVVGPLACLLWVDLPARVVAGVLVAGLVLCVGLLLLRVLLRRGLSTGLVRVGRRLRLLRRVDWHGIEERARRVDAHVGWFRSRHPGAYARAILFVGLARVTAVVELWLFLTALQPAEDPARTLFLAVLMQSVTQVVTTVANLLPGDLGVTEASAALLFEVLGLDPAVGFSVALLRRLRRVLGIGVGLVLGGSLEASAPATRVSASETSTR